MGSSFFSSERRAAGKAPLAITAVAASVSLLAGCATPAPPPPPPPPPPPVVQAEPTPYRPLPPGGAAYVMKIPAKNLFGKRQTVNRGLSDDEKVWHFRSAWNVAALNCTAPQYEPVLTAYSAYISDHADALRAVNERIDREYRRKADSRREGIMAREEQMTSVYNFFALPPARARFCRAALDISNRAMLAPIDPIAFGLDNFALFEEPFDLFFEEYEEYQRASAEWDARFGERFGRSQPGWVAVQQARAEGIVVPSVGDSAPNETLATPAPPAGAVLDPDTGVAVPIVPVQENFVSQPVVEPVPTEELEDDTVTASPQ